MLSGEGQIGSHSGRAYKAPFQRLSSETRESLLCSNKLGKKKCKLNMKRSGYMYINIWKIKIQKIIFEYIDQQG